MTAFVLAVAALTAAALLCVLPALLRRRGDDGDLPHHAASLAVLRERARELDADLASGAMDPASHAQARRDLEWRVVHEADAPAAPARSAAPQPLLAMLLALALPALAAALYFQVGSPRLLVQPPAKAPHAVSSAQLGDMADALARRLREEPGDAAGWDMLARSYTVMGRHRDAAAAYARLVQLVPDDAGILADYADVLATAQGNQLRGEPEQLLARALAADPANVKALALSASAAFQARDYALAERRWRDVLAQLPPDSEFAQATRASIAAARERAQPSATPAPPSAPAPAAPRLAGTVELDPALRAAARPDDTVFIFVRAAAGPGMPLAALRARVAELPLRFEIDQRHSMAGARLPATGQVVVGARISRSGSATAAAGDLEGFSAPVAIGAPDVRVRIASTRE